MKIQCPNCKQNTIDLNYLKETGSQSGNCSNCNSHFTAKYEQNTHREFWGLEIEHPLKKTEETKKPKPYLKRPWPRFWIVLIILWILFTAWAKLSK